MSFMKPNSDDFYILTYESGAERTPLPTWASHTENPLHLKPSSDIDIKKHEVTTVPSAFQLHHLFSKKECQRFINITESLGYTQDAAVSLPRSVRHNENLVWIIDETTHEIIWHRCQTFMQEHSELFTNKKALGLNRRFRFYKYEEGDFFKPHTDGAWPGSAVVNKRLIQNAYPDRYSQMTFLIFLSEGFEGGETAFYVDKNDPDKPAKRTEDVKIEEVKTPMGGVLCFAHGNHKMHCLHGSRKILSGVKYIIRTDVLFEV